MARKNDQNDKDQVREPTDDDIAAVVGRTGIGRESMPIRDVGRGPSGNDEDEDAAQRRMEQYRQRQETGDGVVPPDLRIPVEGRSIGPSEFEARMAKAMESITARMASGQSDGTSEFLALAMMQLSEGLKGLREATLKSAQMQADMQRRVHRPENQFTPNISVFNLRGDKDFPRPQLKCEMLLPWPVSKDTESLTREEIELLNLLQPGEWMILRTDRTRLKLTVRGQYKLDSTTELSRLSINHDTGFNNDNHRQMPHDWIRQLAMANPKTRRAAVDVLTMDEEEALILADKFNDGRTAAEGERVVSVGE